MRKKNSVTPSQQALLEGEAYSLPFAVQLAAFAAAVEPVLEQALSVMAQPYELPRPRRLLEAMRYAVLGGGKRLRGFLAYETARLLDGEGEGALRVAAALELLHAYSLIHDDLPAMDDDTMRRGKPCLHIAFDEATAILAGDALQTLAFDLLADPATHPDPAIRVQLVLRLTRASGIGGMAGGQMRDLAAEGRFQDLPPDEEAIRLLQAMKTGALLSASIMMGAILGRADETQEQALSAYGTALGNAFQMADDLLDRDSQAHILGKTTGKDVARGKITLIERLGIDAARARLVSEGEKALESLIPFGGRAQTLREALHFTIARTV
jgi:farnesyl diphosphate synthase